MIRFKTESGGTYEIKVDRTVEVRKVSTGPVHHVETFKWRNAALIYARQFESEFEPTAWESVDPYDLKVGDQVLFRYSSDPATDFTRTSPIAEIDYEA